MNDRHRLFDANVHDEPSGLQQSVLLSSLQVSSHHFGAHLLHADFGGPAQLGLGFRRVTQQSFNLGGTEVARVDPYDDLSGFEPWGLVSLYAGLLIPNKKTETLHKLIMTQKTIIVCIKILLNSVCLIKFLGLKHQSHLVGWI